MQRPNYWLLVWRGQGKGARERKEIKKYELGYNIEHME